MKTKGSKFKTYLSTLWWALSGKQKYMLFETCDNCGSYNITMSGVKKVFNSDGHTNYYAKYLCRTCGASAIATEIWYDDNFVNFNYTGDKKRSFGCCIIHPEYNKILLGLRCKPGDKPEWCFVGGIIENTEKPNEVIFRKIKEGCGLTVEFVQHVNTIKTEERDDFIFVTNEFTGEPMNQPEEIAELKWFNLDELDTVNLYPAIVETLEILKAKGVLK